MKARLWFVHKGIERLFEGQDVDAGLELAERISGDTAVGHALAYCLAVEDACGIERARECARRCARVLLELERLYNHVADIGALCNDVGFGLAQAWALTLREQLLRLNREITGHRLLRGGVVPGGARLRRLPDHGRACRDRRIASKSWWTCASSNALVMERFSGTASLDRSHARDLGVVGVAGRASGLAFDARTAHPFVEPDGRFLPGTPVRRRRAGAFTRAGATKCAPLCRSLANSSTASPRSTPWRRLGASRCQLRGRGSGSSRAGAGASSIGSSSTPGASRPGQGRRSFVPQLAGLPVSLADTIVPDFPLANKSFNLSYAGNDL